MLPDQRAQLNCINQRIAEAEALVASDCDGEALAQACRLLVELNEQRLEVESRVTSHEGSSRRELFLRPMLSWQPRPLLLAATLIAAVLAFAVFAFMSK